MSGELVEEHFSKYEMLYLGLGCGLTIAGITYLIMRGVRPQPIGRDVIVTAGRDVIVTSEKVEANTISIISNNRMGSPSWVVKCLETGEEFMSQRSAATTLGISESNISRHLNGLQESAQGYHFVRLGLAA